MSTIFERLDQLISLNVSSADIGPVPVQGDIAADATVAARNVTEACSYDIGGDCFVLYYNNQTKRISFLNGSNRNSKSFTLDILREMGIREKQIPSNNLNAVTVTVDSFL
ncbi:unnamed protein product [Rotaria magnacalcarata]|uniref:Uncharacterized protein n=2 Tax=Rotaria magnacalcarata TaxID=392030 RepID=A0A816W975_9BILA|nr:unnamed protein product [Rotaria magnacalcarata]